MSFAIYNKCDMLLVWYWCKWKTHSTIWLQYMRGGSIRLKIPPSGKFIVYWSLIHNRPTAHTKNVFMNSAFNSVNQIKDKPFFRHFSLLGQCWRKFITFEWSFMNWQYFFRHTVSIRSSPTQSEVLLIHLAKSTGITQTGENHGFIHVLVVQPDIDASGPATILPISSMFLFCISRSCPIWLWWRQCNAMLCSSNYSI